MFLEPNNAGFPFVVTKYQQKWHLRVKFDEFHLFLISLEAPQHC